MPKRTLAVLGMAAFAGLALPFGVPQVAQATFDRFDQLDAVSNSATGHLES